ncbi:unnamed protein product [Paramecium sonneborni]|uniref:Uncharacterized protein n=1 Tax=Paramecium sonneborni TaxID=65129 RepID=A0A8S1RSK7_9CILI|nr:unnamed protein product [Paramecium sonneborni]
MPFDGCLNCSFHLNNNAKFLFKVNAYCVMMNIISIQNLIYVKPTLEIKQFKDKNNVMMILFFYIQLQLQS